MSRIICDEIDLGTYISSFQSDLLRLKSMYYLRGFRKNFLELSRKVLDKRNIFTHALIGCPLTIQSI